MSLSILPMSSVASDEFLSSAGSILRARKGQKSLTELDCSEERTFELGWEAFVQETRLALLGPDGVEVGEVGVAGDLALEGWRGKRR